MIDPLTFFKCLAAETRLESLLLIQTHGELCISDLMESLPEIRLKVSRHLALLRKYKIVLDRRRGQHIYYRLNPQLPSWAKNLLIEISHPDVIDITSTSKEQ